MHSVDFICADSDQTIEQYVTGFMSMHIFTSKYNTKSNDKNLKKMCPLTLTLIVHIIIFTEVFQFDFYIIS